MKKYLVTGASGPLGKGIVEFLLAKGVAANTIGVLVRNAEKVIDLKSNGVHIYKGDYQDYNSLIEAFSGVEKLIFVSGNDIPNRIPQHENVIKAAKEVGVKHIIYAGSERKDETENSPMALNTAAHLKTEQWLKESGIPHTILRNSLYMDLVPFLIDKVLETGVVYYPAEQGKAAMVLRTEMAEATANITMADGQEGKTYSFSNSESYSFQDVADVVSIIAKKPITYVSPKVEEYIGAFVQAGLPEMQGAILSAMAISQAKEEYATVSNDLEQILGRKPTTLADYLSKVYY